MRIGKTDGGLVREIISGVCFHLPVAIDAL